MPDLRNSLMSISRNEIIAKMGLKRPLAKNRGLTYVWVINANEENIITEEGKEVYVEPECDAYRYPLEDYIIGSPVGVEDFEILQNKSVMTIEEAIKSGEKGIYLQMPNSPSAEECKNGYAKQAYEKLCAVIEFNI
ncbi:MAG: hypothetical protein GY941_22625 [Planctomycetes bacterium]|nr:hypothetical protein [Planctomycetota bacterium]